MDVFYPLVDLRKRPKVTRPFSAKQEIKGLLGFLEKIEALTTEGSKTAYFSKFNSRIAIGYRRSFMSMQLTLNEDYFQGRQGRLG